MAIPIITSSPSIVTANVKQFSPAGNPIRYTISGTSAGLLYFKIQLIEKQTSNTIYIGNIFPTPVAPTIASFNVSNQLSSLVRSDVDNQNILVLEKPKNIIGYQLIITEWGLSGGTGSTVALSSGYTGDTAYAFDAMLDVFNFTTKYTGSTYIANTATTTNAKFLTSQPDYKAVNDYSFEQLYLLQNENPSLTIEYVINGVTHDITYTGTNIQFLISAGTPEVRAKAYIAITGSGTNYSNIQVSANTSILGNYIEYASGTTSSIAANLASSLSSNPYGYDIDYTAGDSRIGIIAPIGSGSGGNSISLTANKYVNTYTGITITSETRAIAYISGYNWCADTGTMSVLIMEPTTTRTLYYGPITNSGGTTSTYTDEIVAKINTNPYGYVAARSGIKGFAITARTGMGDTINGYPAWLYDDNNYITTAFSGGSTLGSGVITYTAATIPYSITGFTGGVDAVADLYSQSMERMIRLNTSPKKLLLSGYTGFAEGQSYVVRVKNASGVTMTEDRHYVYRSELCNEKLVNIVFTNSWGGVDSVQMIEPQEVVTSTKLNIKKNNVNLRGTDIYKTDGVYNENDMTYKNTSKANIRVWTKPMTDIESTWLVELVNSHNIYVEMTDSTLVPLQLVTTTYTVQKNRYIKEAMQFQFEFAFADNQIPSMGGCSYIIN